MSGKGKLLSSVAVAIMCTANSGNLFAEEAVGDNSDFNFEEIVVTARKREESIQDTPLAISAFTSAMIESAGIRDLADVAKFTPGFSYDDEFGRTASDRPVIRGQSTVLGASGVSTFVDGILITGTILDYDINDVQRIEVIKGPQSALYGRNTYSGAINIITKSPSDELSGNIKAGAAEFGQYEVSGAIRGPITDTLSGSLTARYLKRGGTFTNIYDNSKVGQQESESVSGVLYFHPNEKLDIRARLRYSHLNDDQIRMFSTVPEDNNCFGPDIGGTYLGNFRYFCGEIKTRPINTDDVRLLDEKGFDRNNTYQSSISVNYQLTDEVSLTWLNGYNTSSNRSRFDFASNPGSLNPFSVNLGSIFGPGSNIYVIGGPVADFASDSVGNSWDISTEMRVAYDSETWHGLLGGYYFRSSNNSRGVRKAPSAFAAILTEGFNKQVTRQEAQNQPSFFSFNLGDSLNDLIMTADRTRVVDRRENIAMFGSIEHDVTSRLTMSGEVRIAFERIINITDRADAIYKFPGNFLGIDHNQDGVVDTLSNISQRSATFRAINPRFTAKYKVSDHVNLYAIAARGNKPGGFNNSEVISAGFGTFDEESVWSFEAGAKTNFMDGRVIFNIDGFHNTISGYQLTQSVVIPTLNESTTVIANTGKVRVEGVEVEAVFAPEAVPGLIINVNYAYTHSKFLEGTDINEGKLLDVQDDNRVNCSTGTSDGLPCLTTADNVIPGSIVGRQLPRAPEHMVNVGVNYTRDMTDELTLVLNANMSYESKKFVQVQNLAYTGSATLVNASITFKYNDQFSLSFWGKNLTKEDSAVSALRFADPTESFQRSFMGTPRVGRQFGVTGSFDF